MHQNTHNWVNKEQNWISSCLMIHVKDFFPCFTQYFINIWQCILLHKCKQKICIFDLSMSGLCLFSEVKNQKIVYFWKWKNLFDVLVIQFSIRILYYVCVCVSLIPSEIYVTIILITVSTYRYFCLINYVSHSTWMTKQKNIVENTNKQRN